VVALKKRAPGRGVGKLRRLLELKRTYPAEPFLAAIEQALRYGLFDLARLERLILERVPGLDFIARAENLVFIGAPGTGKSGLAIGLLRQALINGYRARFYKAQDLFDELYASLADRSTSRLLNRLSRYDVLQIDELGYLTLKPEQVNAFFKLMDLRYARRPTLITSNLDYPDWYELFQRKLLVDALLDRLRHHCITIRIDGPSLRVPENDPRS